jgi:hypothetical protein
MEEEAHLGTFMALRTLQDMLWDIEERDLPAERVARGCRVLGEVERWRSA